jgi:GNAT superfamily N-acetyltransferase
MFVRPEVRGRGIADDLVRTVLCVAGATGRRLVWLDAQRGSMDRAIAVYSRHGFVETDDRRPGSADGLLIMERRLADDECDERWTPC